MKKSILQLFFLLILSFLYISEAKALTPIARFDVVPFQRIDQGEAFGIGVVAFSKNGIDRVEFFISGQGYKGQNPRVAYDMSLNPRTNTWEYWVPISASEFSSDGPIEVSAVVYGKDGDSRDKKWLINSQFSGQYGVNCWADSNGTSHSHYCELTSAGLFSPDMIYSEIYYYKSGDKWWEGVRSHILEADSNSLVFGLGQSYGASPDNLDFEPVAGDGFVLSRAFGLDPIVLFVNPNKTLPEPVVYMDTAGNDETGEVNNPDKPYLTLGRAFLGLRNWMEQNHGYRDIGGARVRFNPGDHTMSNGGLWNQYDSRREWVTLEANEDKGANKNNTNLWNGPMPTTHRVHVKNLGLKTSNGKNVIGVGSSFSEKHLEWIDDSILVGSTKFDELSSPINHLKVWYTDSYFTNMGKVISEAYLARNIVAEEVGDDVFVRSPFVVNAYANDVDPRDGTCTGGACAHADCWQWWGQPIPNNAIIYNYDCRNGAYQGLFARTQDGNMPVGYQPPVVEGVAIINMRTDLIENAYGAANSWLISTDHMLMWHNSFNDEFNFWNDGDSSGAFPLNITNFDVKGNNFYNLELNAKYGDDNGGDIHAPGISLSSWDSNHYQNKAKFFDEMPGTNISSGDPRLNADGTLMDDSPLINRLPYSLIPIDSKNKQRDSLPDVGALEFQAANKNTILDVNNDFSINTSDALLTLRRSLGLDMGKTNWQDTSMTGDVDCNGVLNTTDALLLLRYSLGLDMSGTEWCG